MHTYTNVPVEVLNSRETIRAGVVGQDPSVHVVFKLCEEHGGSRGVASYLPHQLYKNIMYMLGIRNVHAVV